jgi:hypothetical protein
MHGRLLSNFKEGRKASDGLCTIPCTLGKREKYKEDNLIKNDFWMEMI